MLHNPLERTFLEHLGYKFAVKCLQFIHYFATCCVPHQCTLDLHGYSICTFISSLLVCVLLLNSSTPTPSRRPEGAQRAKVEQFPPLTLCTETIAHRRLISTTHWNQTADHVDEWICSKTTCVCNSVLLSGARYCLAVC